MIILFALLGIGAFIYLLLSAATYALPLIAALCIGFAMRDAGAPGASPLIVAILVFGAVLGAGRVALALLPRRQAGIAIMLVFAAPAAVAGFSIGKGLLSLVGVGGGVTNLVLALGFAAVSAIIAAGRTVPTAPV